MKQKFFLAILGLLTLAACKKDDNNNPTQSPQQKIIGTWNYSADYVDKPLDFTGTGQLTTNIYGTQDSCTRDNQLTFNTNNTAQFTEGPTSCSTSAPNVIASGNWSLNGNDLSFLGETYTLIQLDDHLLKFSIKDTLMGEPVTETIEFKR